MALVTVVGYPSSGKTTRAKELEALLSSKLSHTSLSPQLKKLKVVVVNDESLHIGKEAYDDSKSEKPARASLFSATVRSLKSDTIAIIDAMNYIKGSRYQMYCAAREAGARTCTVFVATRPDKCKEWNEARPEGSRYSEATLDNLISRFEEPNSAARWDAPLITIPFDDPPIFEPDSIKVGEGGMPLGSTEGERIWEAITTGEIKPAHFATSAYTTSSTSYLSRLESTTTLLIQTLLSQQSLSPLSGPTTLQLATTPKPTKVQIDMSGKNAVSMPQLQRLKKQFSKMNQQAGMELDDERIASLFAKYLEDGLR